MSEKDEKKSSRRDAIKRLGLLGVGAALIPAASRPQMLPLQNCYNSCSDEYYSVDSYGSYNTWSMGYYNSISRYTSGGCYNSCEHTSYSSYSSYSSQATEQ